MFNIQYLLVNFSNISVGVVMALFSLGFAISGLVIVRHFIPHLKTHASNNMPGYIFAAVSGIYAVLLAFTTVTAWERFNDANQNASKEANYIADVYRDAGGLAPEFQMKLKPALRDMLQGIIQKDWPSMAEGSGGSSQVHELSTKVWTLYYNYEPKTAREQAFFADSISKLNDIGELRRVRILESHVGIHPMLWFVLIVGGFLTISFTFFFSSKKLSSHLLMSSFLAVLISIVLFDIVLMYYPFSGELGVKPAAFQQVLSVYYKEP
jgi:hypothetical protein